MAFYATNGKSVKSLGIDDVFGAGFESSLATAHTMAPRTYDAIVPFVRRAVRLRASAVAGVPITLQRGKRDLSQRPEFAALMGGLQEIIWRTEFALCLSPYGAYWRRTMNPTGLNPTPEWLLPLACWPLVTAKQGFSFVRYVRPWGVPQAGRVEMLPLEEVVYFWLPSLDRANWPGTPPGTTAIAAADALYNRDLFVSGYFKRGAVKSTLLSVPAATQPDERAKLRDWWRQLVAGIANAWRSIVISADVKPIVIGDSLKDTESEQLTCQYRQDVAAAFDVPESMLLANAANYATASVERISFYEETVFPELTLILGAINGQWLRDAYDAELVMHPEQTEARQDAQVQQAQAITDLVGKPVLTVDEGRAWLGLEPMPKDKDEEAPQTEERDYAAMEEEEQQEEQAAAQEEEAVKAITSSRITRAAERTALYAEHRTTREQTRERHQQERRHLQGGHIEARQGAADAASRLRLVQRQRADLAILDQRHAAERQMLRQMHAAERGRLRDRHAVERAFEGRRNGHAVEVTG